MWNRRAVIQIVLVCMTAFLYGCERSSDQTPSLIDETESYEEEFTEDIRETKEDASEEPPQMAEAEREEPLLYPKTDYDQIPDDTARYIESSRKEITEIRCVESVVDENDPSTYKVIQSEKEVTVTEEIPSAYQDLNGNEIYTYSEGIWYSSKYSTGDITLGIPDEEMALFFLNLDGFYDDYEIADVSCREFVEDGMPQYQYHVLYRKTAALEAEPENTGGLIVSRTREVTRTGTEILEEKVPVLLEREVLTGEYEYYGWQTFEDDLYYFDEYGEKLTGMHVIRGIYYIFDEDGMKISDNGIHVSEHNGAIDWKKVRDAQIDYAVLCGFYRSCKSGELIRDSRFEENVIGARRADIDVGMSVYSQAVSKAEMLEEIYLALELATAHKISRPLMIVSANGDAEFSGRADSLSAEDRTGLIRLFCEKIQEAGYTPVICAEKGWLEQCLKADELKPYSVCIIQYNTNVTYTGDYDVWQYTARGTVDGVSGNIGLNISHIKSGGNFK